ncbi:MAG: tRNA (N6-threonylcarbamoyladenosine(37)-N6)-methyltransferase TrmO [Planctomycetota bacterium]
MSLRQIGVIHSPFAEPSQAPIQAAMAAGSRGTVEVSEEYAPGLKDLEGFERIWLLYWFDRAGGARLKVKPYLDVAERGLFACRAPCRPNPIGISPVRLVRIERNILHVEELDILDGTPLLDIKPYVPQFDCFPAARSGWLDRVPMPEKPKADGRFAKQQGPGED